MRYSFGLFFLCALAAINLTAREMVKFDLKEEPLIDAINRMAGLKGINVVFPAKQDGLQVKVSYMLPDPISIDDAWRLLETIAAMAKFSIVPHGDFYSVVAEADTFMSPLPLWVNVPVELLPDGSEAIRYLYSFVNLDIADKSGGAKTNLQKILKDMMPGPTDKVALFNDSSNSILLTGHASVIKSVMSLIKELDKSGFREAIDVIELKHASAGVVESIIKELIPGAAAQNFRYPVGKQQQQTKATYFAKSTRVVPMANSNSLALMGKIEAVERLGNFIRDYLDTPPESDRTLLHVKHLNNLNAEEFAKELSNLVKRRTAGDQSKGRVTQDNLLKDVIIVPEKIQRRDAKGNLKDEFADSVGVKIQAAGEKNIPVSGGNNLIIAARETDWKLIDDLINQLDRPRLQVALEVLVVDVTITDQHLLGAQNRGHTPDCSDETTVKWQTAHLTNPILEVDTSGETPVIDNKVGLNANLLQSNTQTSTPPFFNVAALATSGTTVLSFKDKNGIRTVIEALEAYQYATILSQPFVVTTNHKSATIYVGEERRFSMDLDTASTGGPAVQNIKNLDAALAIGIQPRISTADEHGNVNLEIIVRTSDFAPGSNSSTRFSRTIRTNSNVKNQDVLVLGGLTRVTTRDTQSETPPLSKIPLVGSFLFKKRNRDYDRANLMIFISPTIINTRPTGGPDEYTLFKENQIKDELNRASENFDILQDPITRTFFVPATESIDNDIDYFINSGEYVKGGRKDYDKIIAERVQKLEAEKGAATHQAEAKKTNLKQVLAGKKSPIAPNVHKEVTPEPAAPQVDPLKEKLADKQPPIKSVETKPVSKSDALKDKLKDSNNPFKK